jgi:hypothetical protein
MGIYVNCLAFTCHWNFNKECTRKNITIVPIGDNKSCVHYTKINKVALAENEKFNLDVWNEK